jgi:hypothetical protein
MVKMGEGLKDIGNLPAVSFSDLLIAGVVKSAEERLIAATPLGNGNLISGGVKLFGGAICPGHGVWKYGKIALTIDGVEDVIQGILGTFMGGGNGFGLGGVKEPTINVM